MPTRHGWLTLIAGLGLVVAGRLFGAYELFVIGGGLIGITVIALAILRLRPVRLTVARRVNPAQVHAGDVARVEIMAHNQANARTPLVELLDPVSGSGGARLDLAPFAGTSTATATYRLPTHKRGALRVGPLSIVRSDVLGLCATRVEAAPAVTLIVYPRWHRVVVPGSTTAGGALGDHLRQRALGRTGDEFRALRDYQPGDDLRKIHWRASARNSEGLVVREMDAASTRSVVVLLDVAASAHTEESFELAIEAAASVVLSSADQRVPVQFATTGGGLFTLGAFSAEEVLAHLAAAQPSTSASSVSDAVAGLGSRAEGGVLVIVTGAIDTAATQGLRHVHGTDAVIIVACCPDQGTSAGSGMFVVDASAGADFPTAWHRLVAPRAAQHVRIEEDALR